MKSVALLCRSAACYSAQPPFHPPDEFPELGRAGIRQLDASNGVYGAVRDVLALLRLDDGNLGTPRWNPLGAYVRPGDKVVIKPNLVLHEFGAQLGAHCLTTHGSVIRAVLDYVYLATGPEGRITIADAPLQGADFERVIVQTGLPQIQDFYRKELGCEVQVIDLRQVHAVIDESSSLIRRVERLPGDPMGYCEIDLGEASRLHEVDHEGSRYVVGDYDCAVTNARHHHPRHSYLVSRTVLDADTVVCVPKLKTHSKTGVTVCLKNMVGIIGSKDCLPHHRLGKTNQGGDEFPPDYPSRWLLSARAHGLLQGRVPVPVWKLLRRCAGSLLGAGTPSNGNGAHSRFFPSGGWHGNDTIWRTVDDLNRILFFYSPSEGSLQLQPQRRYFAVVDGIVAMEGNGPLRGTPRSVGIVLGGDDPFALDVVSATLLGFDWKRIRLLKGVADSDPACPYSALARDLSELELLSNVEPWQSLDELGRQHLQFQPPAGWRQFVEAQHVG
jgi:uncharacterized protein (DUF362 family)